MNLRFSRNEQELLADRSANTAGKNALLASPEKLFDNMTLWEPRHAHMLVPVARHDQRSRESSFGRGGNEDERVEHRYMAEEGKSFRSFSAFEEGDTERRGGVHRVAEFWRKRSSGRARR